MYTRCKGRGGGEHAPVPDPPAAAGALLLPTAVECTPGAKGDGGEHAPFVLEATAAAAAAGALLLPTAVECTPVPPGAV